MTDTETTQTEFVSKAGALHQAHADFIKDKTGVDVTPEQVYAIYSTRVDFRNSDTYRVDYMQKREAEKAEQQRVKEEAKEARAKEREEAKAKRDEEKAKKAEEREAAREEREKAKAEKAQAREEAKAEREKAKAEKAAERERKAAEKEAQAEVKAKETGEGGKKRRTKKSASEDADTASKAPF